MTVDELAGLIAAALQQATHVRSVDEHSSRGPTSVMLVHVGATAAATHDVQTFRVSVEAMPTQ